MSKASELLIGLKESIAKRPIGIIALAVLFISVGLVSLMTGLGVMRKVFFAYWIPQPRYWSVWLMLLWGMLNCVLGVIPLTIGIGLWKLWKWARDVFIFWMAFVSGAVTMQVITLAVRSFFDRGTFITVDQFLEIATMPVLVYLVTAMSVWYMYRPHVKRAFGIPVPSSAPPTQAESPSGPAPA